MLIDLCVLLAVVALALLIRHFLFEPIRVKGSSMLSTLNNGEMMLVTKAEYHLGEPERHQVVICHYPNRYVGRWKLIRQYFVKRIIALPGETIEVRDGVVHINGDPLSEPYLDPAHTTRAYQMAPVTLGANEYFVMGDNRDNSNDSRRIGPIDRSMVVGRVRQVFYPF